MNKYDYRQIGYRDDGKGLLVRTRVISFVARLVGLQIKIGGCPYGADYYTAYNTRDEAKIPLTNGSCLANTTV